VAYIGNVVELAHTLVYMFIQRSHGTRTHDLQDSRLIMAEIQNSFFFQTMICDTTAYSNK
jgi:hypothetical protein